MERKRVREEERENVCCTDVSVRKDQDLSKWKRIRIYKNNLENAAQLVLFIRVIESCCIANE